MKISGNDKTTARMAVVHTGKMPVLRYKAGDCHCPIADCYICAARWAICT